MSHTASSFMSSTPHEILDQLMSRVNALEAQNQELRQAIVAQSSTESITISHDKEPKVSLPSKFSGDRDKFNGFLNQVTLLFNLNASRYPTDHIKIYTIGSLLEGTALEWFSPLVSRPEIHQDILKSYQDFIKRFQANFGPVDPAGNAATKLQHLYQGKWPVSTYSAKFQNLAANLAWNDEALRDQYRLNLSIDIKNMLIGYPKPTTLQELIALALECDNRLMELEDDKRRLFARGRSTRQVRSPTMAEEQPANVVSEPAPMEIGVTRRGPLTPAERDYRLKNGLCFVCGSKDHMRATCPVARRGNVSGSGNENSQ